MRYQWPYKGVFEKTSWQIVVSLLSNSNNHYGNYVDLGHMRVNTRTVIIRHGTTMIQVSSLFVIVSQILNQAKSSLGCSMKYDKMAR